MACRYQGSGAITANAKAELRQRLLRDISELQRDPYPYISLYPTDDLTKACLVLTPEGQLPLHMTMELSNHPYSPPRVSMQSKIEHPNVFGSYICASILNTAEGYTPAYTLKSIAIQLLSFFNSDKIEQDYGDSVSLKDYKRTSSNPTDTFTCNRCLFKAGLAEESGLENRKDPGGHRRQGRSNPAWSAFKNFHTSLPNFEPTSPKASEEPEQDTGNNLLDKAPDNRKRSVNNKIASISPRATLASLPDEILLHVFEELSHPDILAIADIYPRVQDMLVSYDYIRMRELQCFYLKESFLSLRLGVGVSCPNRGLFASEFDLLSRQAYYEHRIRSSIHGLSFDFWLPLPLSRRHWRSVRGDVDESLRKMGLHIAETSYLKILARFLNDIVVKFSQEADKDISSLSPWSDRYQQQTRSTLRHASEKAVEAYFALFHLLLCLAYEKPDIVAQADRMVASFLAGETSKTSCPNVGILLVASLISTSGLTEPLMRAIMNEAIKRNVVWMLDARGSNMPELAYFEPSTVSRYRLQNTFRASLTSYRLLMFCRLFCQTARSDPDKPLSAIRDVMFDRHGAPPSRTAATMAADIRRIKTIDSFPAFMNEVGIEKIPSDAELTSFLRNSILESEKAGYSKMAINQSRAFALRWAKEPDVEVAEGINRCIGLPKCGVGSFFPGNKKKAKGTQ